MIFESRMFTAIESLLLAKPSHYARETINSHRIELHSVVVGYLDRYSM